MRRIVVMVLGVVLALAAAAPMAAGQNAASTDLNKEELTQKWWDWAMTEPSPLDGSYKGGEQCDGEFVDGVFFLAGAASSSPPPSVKRTCTVPADTPVFFPVVNVICSEAFEVAGQNPPDPEPYDTACATPYTDDTVDPPSHFYAKVDGENVDQERIASGIFDWTIESANNAFGLPVGTFESGSDGLWVLLEDGLQKSKHTIEFGGTYVDTPFGSFEGTKVTYNLKAKK